MTARQSRLDIIKAIIQTQEIGSQDELAQALAKEGVRMTQATLSRDLKLLKVVKGFSPKGRSIYMMPDNPYYRRVREHRQEGTAIRNGFMSIRISGQLAVIKCRPGYASGLASDIDSAHIKDVIGTIAGDDTIFLALEEGFNRDTLEDNLRSIAPVYPGSQL
ncbi:MAG: arginine repressor [Bacteroidaceae bacterium]|nr:arginine repressor [Bacteroidaceae bacterium]